MFCQKCRSPIKVDSSLEDLNPAAFDLLLRSAGTTPRPGKSALQSRPPYPQERRELYDAVAHDAKSPVYKRVIPAPRSAQTQAQARPASPGKAGAKENPAMSFVMLSESQVVSPGRHQPDAPRHTPKGRWRGSVDYVAVADQRTSLSQQMETTARLFEILSARSDIDHPICVECTDLLVEGLQKRLSNATRERDAFVEFLKRINADIPTDDERRKVEEELRTTQAQEAAAFAELKTLEQEKTAVDDEIAALSEEEARQLDLEESQFWRSRNAFALTLSDFQNERDAVNMQYDHDSRQLQRLQRTNVYNDTFCIGHDGYFGTINGLRLGRLPSQPVEWAEINAAWGQTLLLLATVAEKLGYGFRGYRLKPMGSTSKIEKIEYPAHAAAETSSTTQRGGRSPARTATTADTTTTTGTATPAPKVTVLELYSSGDLPLGRMFLHRRFDNAMVAFLECVRQLGAFALPEQPPPVVASAGAGAGGSAGTGVGTGGAGAGTGTGAAPGGGGVLPYPINRDKIGDASIKLGFNQDEAWTRACKYTLTCCKFLLAHASNVGSGVRRGAL